MDLRIGAQQFRHQFIPGLGDLVHFRHRDLLRPLARLHEDHILGKDAVPAVQPDFRVGDDPGFVNLPDPGEHGGFHPGETPEIQPLDGPDGVVGPFLGLAVIGHDGRARPLPLLFHLLFRLEDREVELGDQRLIRPGRSLLVVVTEFRGPGHQQHQDDENEGKRDEAPFYLGQFHTGAAGGFFNRPSSRRCRRRHRRRRRVSP